MTEPPVVRLPTVRYSVRQRLTIAVALLTALALVMVGATLFVVESQRIERTARASLLQEVDEFRKYHESAAADSETGTAFSSPDELVTDFLLRNTHDAGETLWAFPIHDEPSYQGETDPRLHEGAGRAIFTSRVEQLRGTGGLTEFSVDGHDYLMAVQPVVQGDDQAAFVVTLDLSALRGDLREMLTTFALLAALSLILIAGLASWIAGRLLRPVRDLRETARSITDGDLGRRLDVTGNDDLAELQRTFNDMLDRLESAFTAQRRLLDDAGHELRTPLTVLRGHLELMDPADVAESATTRTLLLDEIDRMSRLVDDLLVLAKSRRPDFVAAAAADVGDLTRGVLDRSRALADRTWVLDAVADDVCELDAQRITQALLQLADNAVKHTGDGDEIGIGSRRDGHQLVLWVRDTGTGVPEQERERIFERFAQADDVSTEGFGLGLSIVQAIAEAHGGTVGLEGAGRPGATFVLRLPVRGLLDLTPGAS